MNEGCDERQVLVETFDNEQRSQHAYVHQSVTLEEEADIDCEPPGSFRTLIASLPYIYMINKQLKHDEAAFLLI